MTIHASHPADHWMWNICNAPLSGEGWAGRFGGSMPVQGLGDVDGRPFYFRARYDCWMLAIAPEGQDPVANDVEGLWFHEEPWPGKKFAAGSMSLDDAKGCMEKAVRTFRGAASRPEGKEPS